MVRSIYHPLEQRAAKIRSMVALTGTDKADTLGHQFSVSDLTK